MRLIHLIAIAAAAASCYGPEFPAGVRCSLDRQCPGNQICAFDDRCYDQNDVPEPNLDATLSSLEVSRGTLVPAFDPAVTSYTLDLGIGAEDIVITATTSAAAGADIAVNGSAVESGVASAPVALVLGDNQIAIEVTASDNESLVYQIATNRGAGMLQQAYIKASNTDPSDAFGITMAVDGDTLAVGAPAESSSSVGVNAGQDDDEADGSGAVYVFVRKEGAWSQQAYIKASNTDASDRFGLAVALSGDTLAVGAPSEESNATGINGNQMDNSGLSAGAVYVFRRIDEIWTQQAYIKASNTDPTSANDQFGSSIALSGETLAVGAPTEDSSATGVNGNQDNSDALSSGAAYVFTRNGSAWSQQAYLKASNTETSDDFGKAVALFGDTLAVAAPDEASAATDVGGDQTNNDASSSGAVYVFTRTGTSWSQQAYVKASNTDSSDRFGESLSLHEHTLAVGAPGEKSSARGINGDESLNDAFRAGAVYVFTRDGSTWSQQAYIKASNADPDDDFGFSVSVAGDGLAVGASGEASAATGVNGDQADNGTARAGAVYLFTRTGSTWSQEAYLKASNTEGSPSVEFGDFFAQVALSDDTLVVGASGEASSATGIDGNQTDNTASGAGAAYVFE
jgi:hypothetical protein